jgi:hypothetical protein
VHNEELDVLEATSVFYIILELLKQNAYHSGIANRLAFLRHHGFLFYYTEENREILNPDRVFDECFINFFLYKEDDLLNPVCHHYDMPVITLREVGIFHSLDVVHGIVVADAI